MNGRVKELWLDALRSGKYEQGTNKLSYKDEEGKTRYCCLGVLCDLAYKEIELFTINDFSKSTLFGEELEDTILPSEVTEWAELNNNSPKVLVESEEGVCLEYLAELNDNGYSFKELADLIEEHL